MFSMIYRLANSSNTIMALADKALTKFIPNTTALAVPCHTHGGCGSCGGCGSGKKKCGRTTCCNGRCYTKTWCTSC